MNANPASSSDSRKPAPPLSQRFLAVARALRHRNYRLFFFGQGLSLMGSWMQRLAQGWLVYRLTESEWLLGVVGFCGQILTFLVAPFAGVIADRTDRRKLLVITQTLAMLQAFILALLTMTGLIAPWHIVVLSSTLGLINAFDIPIRQSFVVEMIESRDDLPNAIAMNSFLVNSSRLVGPTAAGALIALVGEGPCFLINGLTFIAVIAALMAMRLKTAVNRDHPTNALGHLVEGFLYASKFAPIRVILIFLAAVSLLGVPYGVLLPVFAKSVLKGGPDTLGFLMAAQAIGALIGAVFLTMRKSVRGLGRIIVWAGTLFGASLLGLGFSANLHLSLAVMILLGFGMMVLFTSSNSLLQTIVEDDKRGRVMSFYVMAFMGMGALRQLACRLARQGLWSTRRRHRRRGRLPHRQCLVRLSPAPAWKIGPSHLYQTRHRASPAQ